jgi:outer membrane protein TolC
MFLQRINSFRFSRIIRFLLHVPIYAIISLNTYAQDASQMDTTQYLTLSQCINYALQHQPALNQSLLNISITRATNAINLSGWYPQVNASGNLTHYLQLPSSYVTNTTNPGGPPVIAQTGVYNIATPALSATQSIFSPSLIYASRSAPLYVKQAEQITDTTKINLVASVSKSFYNLLLTLEQITVLKEDTVRLGRSFRDAYHQYVGGIVDETDYKQASITLNNSKAALRQATENIRPQYAALKQLMGYVPDQQFNLSFDTSTLMQEIAFDTTQQLQFEKRIEYQLLNTTKNLQTELIRYYQRSFLPTLSAFYNYNLEFENARYAHLYRTAYPNSLIGLNLSMPIFTGFARVKNVQKAKLQQQVLNWQETDLKLQFNSEYTSALASYRGNLYNLYILQDNVAMARRVYFVVELQYKQGIVAYLNVITAESNLITSEINYINALFQVLSSKIDLQKALGVISY